MQSLPEFRRQCPIWSNCDRMFELMQEIKRPREIDQENYDYKVNFWKKKVLDYLTKNNIVIFNEETIESTFGRYFPREKTNYIPQCMYQIFNILFQEKIIAHPVSDSNFLQKFFYYSYRTSVFIPSALMSLFWQKTSTEILRTRSYGDKKTALICPHIVDNCCEKFLEFFHEHATKNVLIQNPKLYSTEEFEKCLKLFFSHPASRDYIKFVLNYRNLTQNLNSKAIRVAKDIKSKLTALSDSEIKQVDCMLDLKEKIISFEERQEVLSNEIERLKKKTIELRDSGNKTGALNMLRRLKIHQKKLNENLNVILKLDETWLQIEAACDNEKILSVLNQVQKAIASTTGGYKGIEKAQNIVDDLAQVTEENNELSGILAFPFPEDNSTADSIEKELEDLMKTDKTGNIDQAISNLSRLSVNDLPEPKKSFTHLEEEKELILGDF